MIKTVLNPVIRILSVLFLSFFILSTSGYALNTVKGYNFQRAEKCFYLHRQ